jgi:hypothetical protein
MNPKDAPRPEEIAATDEVFQEGGVVPVPDPAVAASPSAPIQPDPAEEGPAAEPPEPTEHVSPLEDHARELQLEFEEQEEEGKL